MAERELILLADIGGTNTRIALGDGAGRLHKIRACRNAEIGDLGEALAAAAAAEAGVDSAVIAVAGPVDAGEAALTNHPWRISRAALERSLGLRRVLLVNDFLAAAHAVPALGEADLLPVRAGDAPSRGNILACGPGTGFGASALVQADGTTLGIAGEAGHMVLGAADREEGELLGRIATGGGALIVEDVISGRGLVALHRALADEALASEEIVAAALSQAGAARRSVAAFLRLFGRVAGDLALAYDAGGGVHLAGGIGRALAPLYRESAFLAAFDDHPPYAERMRRIPVRVILHEQPGLVGALRIGLAARRR